MCFQRSICLLLGRKEVRRRGARRRGVARRLPVWSSSAAWTSAGAGAGGWSTAATGGVSPGEARDAGSGQRGRGQGLSRSKGVLRTE
jgi:hypothetical protein